MVLRYILSQTEIDKTAFASFIIQAAIELRMRKRESPSVSSVAPVKFFHSEFLNRGIPSRSSPQPQA